MLSKTRELQLSAWGWSSDDECHRSVTPTTAHGRDREGTGLQDFAVVRGRGQLVHLDGCRSVAWPTVGPRRGAQEEHLQVGQLVVPRRKELEKGRDTRFQRQGQLLNDERQGSRIRQRTAQDEERALTWQSFNWLASVRLAAAPIAIFQ